MDLPQQGLPVTDIRAELVRASSGDVDWRRGRAWSLVYDSPPWHAAVVDEAAGMYLHENALSSAAYPSVERFESETIAMVSSVLSPGRKAFGVFTSGGTESIFVAVKAYRDQRETGISGRTEIVMPATAHPAFLKAASYLGLVPRIVPTGANGLPDTDQLLECVGPKTLLVALSAPCFPFGTVDPIREVAGALAGGPVGVHVDAAMGGLFLPFLDAAGATPPAFALDVAGVTSVSVDLHKYGYGVKGASVLLFGSSELRRCAYFVDPSWPGGAYAASGLVGTRAVSSAASAWTSMMALGRSGYSGLVARVMNTTRKLQKMMREEVGLALIGDPPMGVFALSGESPRIVQVASALHAKGWWIDTLAQPAALHFVVFPGHDRVVDELVRDATQAVTAPTSEEDGTTSVASYGVMVRGDRLTEDALRDALDRRFDISRETL